MFKGQQYFGIGGMFEHQDNEPYQQYDIDK
jgi:hypothetical protein